VTRFFNTNYKGALKVILVISLLLAGLSGYQVSLGKFADFEPLLYWFGLPYGAYVWGDLLVFSSFWVVLTFALLKNNNPRFFWIALFAFWLVRSGGEALYWFLSQFHPESIPWPQYFARISILRGLSDKEYWVLNQISHQVVAALSLFGLIYQATKILKEKD
jgi:hypothetical protein